FAQDRLERGKVRDLRQEFSGIRPATLEIDLPAGIDEIVLVQHQRNVVHIHDAAGNCALPIDLVDNEIAHLELRSAEVKGAFGQTILPSDLPIDLKRTGHSVGRTPDPKVAQLGGVQIQVDARRLTGGFGEILRQLVVTVHNE